MKYRFVNSCILFLVLAVASCSSTKKTVTEKPAAKKTVSGNGRTVSAPAKKENTVGKQTQPVPNKPLSPKIKEPSQSVMRNGSDDSFFEAIFKNNPGRFAKISANKNAFNLQIIYTEVSRKNNGTMLFTNHYFNKDGVSYFYPASTVKLPLALLALQKINELGAKGVFRNTTMISQKAFSGQTDVYNDPNTPAGKPSTEQYIKRAMLVNDNDACNRLYEFLGQEYINTELKKKGYADAEILHRLGIGMTDDENRHTNEIRFYDNNNSLIYTQPPLFNRQQYSKRNDVSGTGFVSGGKVINRPMDMSKKNRISLEDLHKMLMSLYYPEAGSISAFNITESDRQFLIKLMGQSPAESQNPSYGNEYDYGYTRYLFLGGEAPARSPTVKIYNTSGVAFGQITDVAVIKDTVRNIEFIVSATIYCNADGVINDDKYDYGTVGLPFMEDLGKALYDYEVKKKK